MTTPIKSLLLTSIPLLICLPAVAQEKAGLYLSAYGGSSTLGSTNISESRPALPTISGKADFGSGKGLGGAFGYRYGNGWAAEVAWDYRGHDVKRIGNTPVTGDFASTVLFVNGYYRFQKIGSVRPFVGLGLGLVTEMDIDISRGAASQEYSRRGGLATQAILGGEVDLSDRWSLSADVRLSRMSSGTFKAANLGTSIDGKPKYQPTSLNFGLTYKF